MKRRFLAIIAAFMLATVVGGCGSDNGGAAARPTLDTYDPEASTAISTASITKAQFLQRMNKLCHKGWVEIVDAWKASRRMQDPRLSPKEGMAEAIQTSLLSGVDFYIFDNFRILGAPLGEELRIEEMIGPFQAAVELGWKNVEPMNTFPEVVALFEKYNRLADRHGLDDCLVDDAHLVRLKP